jgi:hypothetical protein
LFGIAHRVSERNTPVGTLVIRVNGQWIEVEYGVGVKRLTVK